MDTNRRWTTITEAAQLLHVNERTIRRWVSGGKISAMDTPTGRIVDVSDKLQEQADIKVYISGSAGHTGQMPGLSDTVRQLSEERDQLAQQVSTLTSERDALSDTVRHLTDEVTSLKHRDELISQERDALRQQVSNLEADRNWLREAHQASLALVAQTQQRLLPAPGKRAWWRFWEREERGEQQVSQ